MNRRWLAGLSLPLLGMSGCWWDELTSRSSHVDRHGNVIPIETMPKAAEGSCTRVDSLGKQILAANPEIVKALVAADPELQRAAAANPDGDFRPRFVAIGVPSVALFHQRGDAVQIVVVSDGLVKKCKNDSELAAVLSSELAKMVAEAQAQSQGKMAEPIDRDPNLIPLVGSDVGGGRTPDQSAQAELAFSEMRNPRARSRTAVVLPDPAMLARTYLTNLGASLRDVNVDDVAKVAPLVRQGESNPDYTNSVVAPRPAAQGLFPPIRW